MEKVHNKSIGLFIYYVILYGTMTLNLLFLSKQSLLILDLVYIIGAIFLLKWILSKKPVLIKTFVFSLLILLPIFHFTLFESFLVGQAYELNWYVFLVSGKLALIPSFIGSLLIVIVKSAWCFFKKT